MSTIQCKLRSIKNLKKIKLRILSKDKFYRHFVCITNVEYKCVFIKQKQPQLSHSGNKQTLHGQRPNTGHHVDQRKSKNHIQASSSAILFVIITDITTAIAQHMSIITQWSIHSLSEQIRDPRSRQSQSHDTCPHHQSSPDKQHTDPLILHCVPTKVLHQAHIHKLVSKYHTSVVQF